MPIYISLKWSYFIKPLYYLITSGPPKKKLKNGCTAGSVGGSSGLNANATPQPKNTVAMLNELRQGLIYTLEGQAGPVHAPIFTMSVEVSSGFYVVLTLIIQNT